MRATEIPTRLQALATRVTEAGIPTTVDAAKVKLPGAWISLDTITAPVMQRGEVLSTAVVHLIANDHGTTRALDSLTTMLDTLLATATAPSNIEITAITLPSIGQSPLPALALTYQL